MIHNKEKEISPITDMLACFSVVAIFFRVGKQVSLPPPFFFRFYLYVVQWV